MAKSETVALLKNLDHRVSVIEQILPTLSTKEDLKDFPTQFDPKGFAMKADLERFATKADLERFATKDDLREESDRLRRYMQMLYEALLDKMNQMLDMTQNHSWKLDEHTSRLDGHDAKIGALDVRVMALENTPRRKR